MEYSRKLKHHQQQQQPQDNNQRQSITNSRCNNGYINNTINNRQNRRLVFSSPTSKLRLSSAVRILHATNLNEFNYDIKFKEARMRFVDKTFDNGIDFGLPPSLLRNNNYYYNNNNFNNNNNINNSNNLSWDSRWRKLRAIFS